MTSLPKRGAVGLMPPPEELARYDFNDRSSLESTIWTVNITFIVLLTVVVSLRAFTRAHMTGRFFADDYLAIFAALFIIVSSGTSIAATRYGLGQHVWNLEPPLENIMDNVKKCVQLMFVAHVFYAAGTAFTKLSIITSYLRIFPHDLLRRVLYVTGVVCVGIGISAIFATIFQCKPVEAAWDFTIEESTCFPFVNFLYANAAVSIVTDFVLVVAPLPCFWSLRLPLRQRLAICALFGVSSVAFAASIVRIVMLRDVQGIDVTYSLVTPLNWTIIECALGIICVSIPPMRPLFKKLAPGFLASYLTGHTGARTGASKMYDEGSRMRSQRPRTQLEMEEQMGRELDRQLMEIELADRKREGSDCGISEVRLVINEKGDKDRRYPWVG
ncbi:hypothetical protein OQA88_11745 [Cercophora sp. LCS_1]